MTGGGGVQPGHGGGSEQRRAYCAWGVILIESGKPQSAEKVLRRAVEIAPDNAIYRVHPGRALRDRGAVSPRR